MVQDGGQQLFIKIAQELDYRQNVKGPCTPFAISLEQNKIFLPTAFKSTADNTL